MEVCRQGYELCWHFALGSVASSKAGTTDPLHFNVTNKDGKVCLLIEGSATFDVKYTLKDNSNGTASFGIPADAVVVAGNCADAASNISVSFFSGYAFNLSFTVVEDKSLLSAVSLDYVYDTERFPNASDVGEAVVAQVTGLSLALSSATESYRCHASVPVALGDRVNAVVADVRLQAFNVVNATYGDESVCTEDTVTTVAPTTPAPQPATPPVNSFVVVDDNNVTCLRVDAGIRFEILYKVNATVMRRQW
ncbi:PREDICTED: lysosome-associated membrane glycoprotein 2-like [Priapulus caudatus]|uniref:Lysosome-associated membrane glycoprotein 5 n=1 Tax=Priapulus caudatus TaxID=37621 RepID=A0ABM1EVW8_PRICU|nr:PREDICTED: lysosome-associated membrane glycoprotein 2-like [Priapulus caudatus]